MQSPLTIFTWGYWGWGNATEQLVQAVDAVEKSRGFKPPMFVDIRIRRTVRAQGFVGDAFKKTVGESRYKWLDALGNLAIQQGGKMQIKDPTAANTLLDIAAASAEIGRRVIFFCACERPGPAEDVWCHRTEVATLLLKAAHHRKLPIQVVEWPGGEPLFDGPKIMVSDNILNGLRNETRKSIPLGTRFPLEEMAGLPWGSLVTVRSKTSTKAIQVPTGPAYFTRGEWVLPVLDDEVDDTSDPKKAIHDYIREWRQNCGYNLRMS